MLKVGPNMGSVGNGNVQVLGARMYWLDGKSWEKTGTNLDDLILSLRSSVGSTMQN